MDSREFYNKVVLMRANQKAFYEMSKRPNRTPEAEAERKKYLHNAISFEKEIDAEIERVQAILEKQNQQ